MKKYFVLICTIAFFFLCIVLLNCSPGPKQGKTAHLYELKERKTAIAYPVEWAATKKRYASLTGNLKIKPDDIKSQIALVSLYINEGRITGDFDFYNAAAIDGIKKILEKDPNHFEALTFQSTILLSEHQFEAALAVAEKVKTLYPYNAYVYGLITDAQVELGNYEDAIIAADQMISLRPDIRSYARIAYIREIHGDVDGAIEAMQMAIDAGAPGDENTEWCRFQLGQLLENAGKWKEAEMQYEMALQNRENFVPALNGLGGIAMEQKDYKKAVDYYLKADSIVSDHASMEGIAAAYEALGENTKAGVVRKEIFSRMKNYSGDGTTSKSEGQNEDHEMAHACMGIGDFNTALKYALLEQKRRPGNIEVNETVATVYAKLNKYEEALPFIRNALRTKSRKPELLQQAAEIYSKTGNTDESLSAIKKEGNVIP